MLRDSQKAWKILLVLIKSPKQPAFWFKLCQSPDGKTGFFRVFLCGVFLFVFILFFHFWAFELQNFLQRILKIAMYGSLLFFQMLYKNDFLDYVYLRVGLRCWLNYYIYTWASIHISPSESPKAKWELWLLKVAPYVEGTFVSLFCSGFFLFCLFLVVGIGASLLRVEKNTGANSAGQEISDNVFPHGGVC